MATRREQSRTGAASISVGAALFLLTHLPLSAAEAVDKSALETQARTFLNKLPASEPAPEAPRNIVILPTEGVQQQRGRKSKKDVQRLNEIRVYSYIDPEDYVSPQKSPMLQFRDRLEKDRPVTPAEKAQAVLCALGFCSIYAPDGAPAEPSLDARAEARANKSTLQLNQFTAGRGALQ